MGIRVKVSSSGSSTDWRVIKKIWAKVNTSATGWKSITGLYSKVTAGWTKMWPGNAPSVRLSDPIRIRIGGYSGTGSGTFPLYSATSPQLFCSTDAGTSGTFLKLWGDDGSYDGVTPITLSARKMKVSTNEDGLVDRTTFSTTDTVDFATISQADRDFAEGYYTFYQLLAKNIDGELDAYSQPIKVIKRRPALLSYTVLSESGGVLQGENGSSFFDVIELNARVRWGWWIKPGGYLGGTPVLKWWRNLTGLPGGTLLKEIDIETGYDYVSGSNDSNYLSNTNTSNVLTIYSNYSVGGSPLQAGEYIVAELYLENSYTAHYAAPVSFYGITGGAPVVNPPTFLTATMDREDGVNLTFGGSSNAASYDIFWNTGDVAPTDAATPDFPGKASPFLDTTIAVDATRWYWVRAKNASGITSSWYPVGSGVTGKRIIKPTFTVNWLGNGGSSFNEGSPWEFQEGGFVTVPSATRIGYTFLLWANTASGAYTLSTSNVGGTWYPPAADITMYARWEINICTIPDVIGETELSAGNIINQAGFYYEFTEYLDTTDPALVGKVAAISPAVGTQPGCGSNVTLTIYRAPVVIAPTAVSAAPPVISRTNNSYIYSTTNGSWNNSPTSYSYQWKASTYIPYPPYYITNNVGTDSSNYTSSSTYNNYDIYCTVTASNSAGSATATSNFITNTPVGDGPSGISVTLTPTGTQMAGTQLTANVSVSSGTSPITYTIKIFKKTGADPTNADTQVASGTTSATHTITTTEASGTPDRFIAYGTATNSYGSTTSYSAVVTSTPYVPASVAPSGGGVTLTPSGTQQAGTTISANVTAMSGTNPITYTTTIRKKTGSPPASNTDGTQVASGSGTGNAVASHVITASEASGTPDQFRAFTTGTNTSGSNTVSSNTVVSTPATTTTTTSAPATTTTTAAPPTTTTTAAPGGCGAIGNYYLVPNDPRCGGSNGVMYCTGQVYEFVGCTST